MAEDNFQTEKENIAEVELNEIAGEPHKEAKSRFLIGISAIVLLIVVGGFVWSMWGADVKEVCFGDGEVCSIEMPEDF